MKNHPSSTSAASAVGVAANAQTPVRWPLAGFLAALTFAASGAKAQLPPDFPAFTVTTYKTNAVADGYVFLTVTQTDPSTNVGYYSMILKNDGTPVWYQKATNAVGDLKVLPNGLLHLGQLYHIFSWTGGGDVYHQILDGNYKLLETVPAGNGYLPEMHDLQMLPNGNVLSLSYYQSYMDLAAFVPGAYPNALVAGAVVQELDARRKVVWQWRSWDHYAFQTYYAPVLKQMALALNPVVDSFHLNTVTMDTDGNLLISNFMVDVEKINRQTGEVMWRLGGFGNQFSFVNVSPLEAVGDFSGHDLSRLANGDILIFCNADQQATRSSKVYEYRLDEVNKIATLVWSYTPVAPCYSWHAGSAQRLPNGNTLIGWGGADIMPGIGGTTNAQIPACTEVTPSGQVVFEMSFDNPLVNSYRAFRFPYPVLSQAQLVLQNGLSVGNTYAFGNLGVSLEVTSGGGGYNAMTVASEPYAPVYPLFKGATPRILPMRVQMGQTEINTMGANIYFDAATFGLNVPTNITVYYRQLSGQGMFTPQTTAYNPVTGQLSVSLTLTSQSGDFGEFVFGYPDVAQAPFPPVLNAVANYFLQSDQIIAPLAATTGAVYSVNQELPISLSWSPKGFAASYALQIGANQDFSSLLVDEPSLTNAYYVWNDAAPNATYYYRVQTTNDGGAGGWAVGAFQTVAPFVQVVSPKGGEAWRRGLSYFVQWNDDLAEGVTVDLYKGGSIVGNLASNVSSAGSTTGVRKWSIPFSLVPGSDYSIRVSSATNGALFAASERPFSLVDAPSIVSSSVAQLPTGQVQFQLTAPGAATVTVLSSTNLSTWQSLQSVSVTNGSALFTDITSASGPSRFYRLQVP